MGIAKTVLNWFRKSDKIVDHPKPVIPLGPDSETKSMASNVRMALAGGFTGTQSSNRLEEARHYESVTYIAVTANCKQLHSATVTAYLDGDQQSKNVSVRKSMRAMYGPSWKSLKALYGHEARETDTLDPSHELLQLLSKPNPHEPGGMFRFRQGLQFLLTGKVYLWNVPNVFGVTCERYVIPTTSVTPVNPSPDLPYGGYRVQPNCMRYIPLDDDGYIRGTPALMRVMGMVIDARFVQVVQMPHAIYVDDAQSPSGAGAQWLDQERALNIARTNGVSRGMDPSAVVELPPDCADIDQDTLDRTQRNWNTSYGGPDNVGKVKVVAPGTKVTVMGQTPKDMGYHEGFEDVKNSLLALYGTPPVAANYQQAGAYAAYYASQRQWRYGTIQPICDMFAESDTFHLAPQFGKGITIEMEAPTLNDESEINSRIQVDSAAKIITKNEARALRGMPPLPGPEGDKLAGPDSPQKPGDASGDPAGDRPESNGQSKPFPKPPTNPETADISGDVQPPDSPFKRDETSKEGSRSKSLQAAIEAAEEGDIEYLASKMKSLGFVDAATMESTLKAMSAADIDLRASEAEPPKSDEHKEAGNYKKGHVTIQGLRITIENPQGSIRSGKDRNGRKWSVEMANHYGYIKGTESDADGDHVDVFIGPNPESELVFVIDQVNPRTREFDEHKAMVGFDGKIEAEKAYLSNYSNGWKGFGEITPMHIDQFKQWLEDGDSSRPVSPTVNKADGVRGDCKSLGLSTSTGSDGGFTVLPEHDSEIKSQFIPGVSAIGVCPICGADAVVQDESSGEVVCRNGHSFRPIQTLPIGSVTKSWITLKPHGDDEDGYVHVLLGSDGKILAAPKHMEGKKVSELGKTHEQVGEPRDTKHPEQAGQQKTKKADEDTIAAYTNGKKGEEAAAGHEVAQQSHKDAAEFHKQNGNEKQADYHDNIANVHGERAASLRGSESDSSNKPSDKPEPTLESLVKEGKLSKRPGNDTEMTANGRPTIYEPAKAAEPYKKPSIPGMQQSLLDDSDAPGQRQLFDYVPPKKGDNKPKQSPELSTLEKISDEQKEREQSSKPIAGQRDLLDGGDETPKKERKYDAQGRLIHPTTGQVQARHGGEVSEVDGQHYIHGQWMPVHGLTPKVENKPKGDGEVASSAGKAKEDKKKPATYEPRTMTPEDIEHERQKREDAAKWSEVQNSPLSSLLRLGEHPGKVFSTGGNKQWKEFAEKIGPEKFRQFAKKVEQETLAAERKHDAEHPARRGENASDGYLTPEEMDQRTQENYDYLKTHPQGPGRLPKTVTSKYPDMPTAMAMIDDWVKHHGMNGLHDMAKLIGGSSGKSLGLSQSVFKSWITLKPTPNHKGVHVEINDAGEITKGPEGFTGKHISELSAEHKHAEKLKPDAHAYLSEQHAIHEKAKENVRKVTGLHAGDIARHENAHRDHSSVEGFDTSSRTAARENPELGIDADAHDTPAKVWNLIREGKRKKPSANSPEVNQLAQQWAKGRKPSVTQPHETHDDSEWRD